MFSNSIKFQILRAYILEMGLFCGHIANISGYHISHSLGMPRCIAILDSLSRLISRSTTVEIVWIKISDRVRFYVLSLRGRFRRKKKRGKVWSFVKPGGGVSEGDEKTILLFLKKVFSREYLESF